MSVRTDQATQEDYVTGRKAKKAKYKGSVLEGEYEEQKWGSDEMICTEVSQRELATPNVDIMRKSLVQGPSSVDKISGCTSKYCGIPSSLSRTKVSDKVSDKKGVHSLSKCSSDNNLCSNTDDDQIFECEEHSYFSDGLKVKLINKT